MRILLASVYPYAYFLLLLLIPFDDYVRVLPNVLLGIIVIGFPFIVKKADFKKLRTIPAMLFFLFLFYLMANAVFLDRVEENMPILSKVLISTGLLILYLPIHDFKKVSKAIIYSSLIAIFFSVANIILVVKETGTFDMWNPLNPIEALLVERLYLGLLCVLSILMSYQAITLKYRPENKYYLANIIINIAFVLLIVSRFAIITLIVLAVVRLLYGKAKWLRIFATLATICTVIFLAFIFNDNIKKRFLYITPDATAGQSLLLKTKQVEPRTVIWKCATAIAPQNEALIKGLGFQGTRDALRSCYGTIEESSKRERFLGKNYNTHNQFLDFSLSTGVISVLLFVLFFVFVFFKNRNQFAPTALLLTMILFALVENYFHRQMGAYYFGIVLILLLLQTSNTKKDTSYKTKNKLDPAKK